MAEAIAAVAVLAALFFILRGHNDDGESSTKGGSTEATTGKQASRGGPDSEFPIIRIRGGEPVGGVLELKVQHGDLVRFAVSSDVTDEVHVHGYDLSRPVGAGGRVAFKFPADLEGVYEVELEERAVPLVELTVVP